MDHAEDETPTSDSVSSGEAKFDAETRFEQALQLLKREGRIRGFIHAKRYGDLDVSGIDFLIFPRRTSLVFAAQIKTKKKRSEFRAALARHLLIHPLVQDVFGIEPRHSPQHIAFRVMKRIGKRTRALCERSCRRRGHKHR